MLHCFIRVLLFEVFTLEVPPIFLHSSEHSSKIFMWRDMAGRQEIGNLSVPVSPRAINNIIERNEQQYLLLSTILSTLLIWRNYTWKYNQQTRESSNLSNWLLITQKRSTSIQTRKQFRKENIGLMSTYLSENRPK